MFAAIRVRAGRWKENLWLLMEALSASDDPHGDEMRRLNERVRQLETEVDALRPPSRSMAPSAAQVQ